MPKIIKIKINVWRIVMPDQIGDILNTSEAGESEGRVIRQVASTFNNMTNGKLAQASRKKASNKPLESIVHRPVGAQTGESINYGSAFSTLGGTSLSGVE